jgi:predicted DNA-binding protein (UPF0251 family)
MTNPWDLNERHIEALTYSIAFAGREKVAADRLGIGRMTLTNRIRDARIKMGAETRIAALIEWDRWARTVGKQS